MNHRYFWDLLESVTGIESWRDPPRFGSSSFGQLGAAIADAVAQRTLPGSKGVVLSVPLSVPLKSDGKELNKESVGLIAYVAAKAAGEIGLSRTEFLDMCNDEFSKAVPPSRYPEPMNRQDVSSLHALAGVVVAAAPARLPQALDAFKAGCSSASPALTQALDTLRQVSVQTNGDLKLVVARIRGPQPVLAAAIERAQEARDVHRARHTHRHAHRVASAPPPPPKPSEDKAYSEADIFAALEGLRPEASEEVVNRLKKLKSAEKKDDK